MAALFRVPPPSQSARWLPRRLNSAILVMAVMVSQLPTAESLIEELYSTNSVCRERYCVNPVFPAIDMLPVMEDMSWKKHSLSSLAEFMGFCGKFVDYDPALPLLNSSKDALVASSNEVQKALAKGIPVRSSDVGLEKNPFVDTVMVMDRLAAARYFIHLAGMGIDAWEHEDPAEASTLPLRACAQNVAKLVCYTYFPKANVGFPVGSHTQYLRPCQNACENYLQACGVDCCDESLRCVWGGESGRRSRVTQVQGSKVVLLQDGYVDAVGPCEQCTGSAAVRALLSIAVLLALGSASDIAI